jgi:hypothetical protein
VTQKEKMKKDLLEDINGYFMQLVYIKDLINVSEDVDKYEKKFESAPNFALVISCALVDSYMLALIKLYDKGDKAKTVPNLIEKCKKNIHLFRSNNDVLNKLNEFQEKITNDEFISHAIKILMTRRDSILVHNDKKFFGEKLKKDKSYLKMYHIWILRDFTEEVLNYLFSQLSSEETLKTKYNYDLCNLFKN